MRSSKYFTWWFISAAYIRCVFQELSADRVKRDAVLMPGAPAEADVSEPYIREIADTSLAEVDRISNSLYRQKVVRIVAAQKQVCIVLICVVTVACSIVYFIKIALVQSSPDISATFPPPCHHMFLMDFSWFSPSRLWPSVTDF